MGRAISSALGFCLAPCLKMKLTGPLPSVCSDGVVWLVNRPLRGTNIVFSPFTSHLPSSTIFNHSTFHASRHHLALSSLSTLSAPFIFIIVDRTAINEPRSTVLNHHYCRLHLALSLSPTTHAPSNNDTATSSAHKIIPSSHRAVHHQHPPPASTTSIHHQHPPPASISTSLHSAPAAILRPHSATRSLGPPLISKASINSEDTRYNRHMLDGDTLRRPSHVGQLVALVAAKMDEVDDRQGVNLCES
ncbi:hypothetical protein M409DRAFT_48625 [Zasmidium cellare ATCC 36951]|uniref:Uncharacterized protein n=1 Tax=Zasmidium cellare ATCC 36951 TaxID=1080233 RepID=A0A6A6D3Q6_ZASCE|nr:uncharacterized protein M409DRAFT_48625 [Zasmidium cellare ATCC 36951]KAF2173685.1 hypothetical protein M409DRAFT_48625 [Zasmidium cellare ATCC 36951]